MRYLGDLKNDKPFGEGILYENQNKYFEGQWMNEGPKGQCKFYKNNGDLNCECTNEEISGKIKLHGCKWKYSLCKNRLKKKIEVNLLSNNLY